MKTILLSLNEVNFSFIENYIDKGFLKNFKNFLNQNDLVTTVSEKEFKNQEPWIQWVSLHTGKKLSEHQIFRLGDIEKLEYPQVFEEIENKGKSLGLIFPFNTSNRLKTPKYFIPDPWTETKFTADKSLESFFQLIRKLVNSNAHGKINSSDYLKLLFGFIKYVPIKNWLGYLKYVPIIKLPGIKAVILDNILADIFINFQKEATTDFSNLMLNACAHTQHHFFFNSGAYAGKNKNPEWYCPSNHDPILHALKLYDKILGKILKLKDTKVIVTTALSQQPHEAQTFFWRFNNHGSFAEELKLPNFKKITPRMSRDFLVEFENESDSKYAEEILSDFKMKRDGIKLFRLDNRGRDIFVELIYPNEILKDDIFVSDKFDIQIKNLLEKLSFVAIRNGEHNGKGYLITNFKHNLKSQIDITEVKDFILNHV